ncbi:hypothetical protein [Chryseobacterium polytrichastri]|uniref:Uncharacterized protein n=1 Tax=Chryseobacterium polytrichastri TaxID=1302687 RepID=A0A1M7BE76_9FLAO|nr:hypothetical protein [Chryseobacterium polytrichastri]SHL53253.1 hypothetical protein SAMN05444267_101961 [Chryseobacterium polytrichastri]
MRIYILSIIFLSLFSCKKETQVSKNPIQKDSTTITESTPKDSLKTQSSKPGIFNFQTELCQNKAYFDENKYTKEELEGTYKLYFQLGSVILSTPQVFKLETLQQVRMDRDQILEKLEKDFNEKKKLIENLKIVNTPYWQNVKKETYQSLLHEYEIRKTEVMAFSDPSVLLNKKYSKNCERFIKALNSNDNEMVKEWRKLREEMSKKNSDPQRIRNEFESRLNSPDKKDYAILDLIVFGWGNCANEEISGPLHDEKMEKEFNSLFIKIDSDCDEP